MIVERKDEYYRMIGGLAQRLQLSEAGINKVLAALRKKEFLNLYI